MKRQPSINLCTVFCTIAVIVLTWQGKPLSVIAVLLCMILIELAEIRLALNSRKDSEHE